MRITAPSTLLPKLFSLPRPYKRALQVAVDTALLLGSFVLAMALRLESLQFITDPVIWATILLAVPFSIAVFVALGFYRAVIRYMTHRAVLSISKGILFSAIVLFASGLVMRAELPASVPLLYFVFAFCSVGGVRFVARALFISSQSRAKVRVVIYGAGQTGRQLAHALFQGPDYAPVAFVDESPDLQGAQVAGLMVFSPSRLPRLIDDYRVKIVLLALPSVTRERRAEIVTSLEDMPVHVQTVPAFVDGFNSSDPRDHIKEVSIDDLLGRDPVPPNPELLQKNVTDRVVMVTGAGGSVGSELCERILHQNPRGLVLVEMSEIALYDVEQRLAQLQAQLGTNVVITPCLANVMDQPRIAGLMRAHRVHAVFHAAAYKHVPLVEQNASEGMRNNLLGTLAAARAAIETGVKSFTLVSTDKAVRPTSIMGASKRLSELVCQALAEESAQTRFSIVRFGNVLGSSGSVIPLFKRQIASGGPVEVTHPAVSRYFMTLAEAAELVIQAGAITNTSGNVFVLDMGEPVNILQLAKRMIRLSGLRPKVIDAKAAKKSNLAQDEVAIVFTKLRPGEKLSEELLVGCNAQPTQHERIFTAHEEGRSWSELAPLLSEIEAACADPNPIVLRKVLRRAQISYGPEAVAQTKTISELMARPEPARIEDQPAAELE